jgi:UDP-N-acetylglucosamine acyltransferase
MNSIHPTAQLIGSVSLGTGNLIGPSVVIVGPVTIGNDNWIGTGAVIGAPPEVRGWDHPMDAGELSSGNGIAIGNRNTFREFTQIHQGWRDVTRIEDDVFLMNQSYVAHDCVLENGATLASSVLLGGHVRVGAAANLGLGTMVHQRRYIGVGAMVGMGSVVTHDVPPYAKAYGNPVRVQGANEVGMAREGMDAETIAATVAAYRHSYDSSLHSLDGASGFGEALAAWRTFKTS